MMDAPEHARYRALVSAAFTPRQVRVIDEQIRSAARKIIEDVVGAGEVDFVQRRRVATHVDVGARAIW